MQRISRRGFSLIEVITVMGIISILLLIALPTLTKFEQQQKFRLAARQFITSARVARQIAMTEQTRVLLTIDKVDTNGALLPPLGPEEGKYVIRTYRYFHKPGLISNEPSPADPTVFPYRAKNYRYALGDMTDVVDPAGLKRPKTARNPTALPDGIEVLTYPGQNGHGASPYWFVYPDANGQYHALCDSMLLWNGGDPVTNSVVDPVNSLSPAAPALFQYWVDINPNGTFDDGSQDEEIITEFLDQFTGERIEVVFVKITGTIMMREK